MATRAKNARNKATAKATKRSEKKKNAGRKWSKKVMETSDALDLQQNIFKSGDPHKIALSLKSSANKSHRRKGTPFQSSMSMLNFYINRAGKNLSEDQKEVLEKAKNELRKVFDRPLKNK